MQCQNGVCILSSSFLMKLAMSFSVLNLSIAFLASSTTSVWSTSFMSAFLIWTCPMETDRQMKKSNLRRAFLSVAIVKSSTAQTLSTHNVAWVMNALNHIQTKSYSFAASSQILEWFSSMLHRIQVGLTMFIFARDRFLPTMEKRWNERVWAVKCYATPWIVQLQSPHLLICHSQLLLEHVVA